MYKKKHISVVIPAHNEAQSISQVVNGLSALFSDDKEPLIDDIIVCDNASDDHTGSIAKSAGARVVYEPNAGYGAACLRAIKNLATTDIVVFVDGDASVKACEVPFLLSAIVGGADLVIGNRVAEQREYGAMLPQQNVGGLIASYLIRNLWSSSVNDLGPFRAITADALAELKMSDKRFGWTVEMQIRALQENMNIVELPVSVLKRIGRSKISGTFRGTLLACFDIFATIFSLWWKEYRLKRKALSFFRSKGA